MTNRTLIHPSDHRFGLHLHGTLQGILTVATFIHAHKFEWQDENDVLQDSDEDLMTIGTSNRNYDYLRDIESLTVLAAGNPDSTIPVALETLAALTSTYISSPPVTGLVGLPKAPPTLVLDGLGEAVPFAKITPWREHAPECKDDEYPLVFVLPRRRP